MIITCEECQASFNLDEGLLKPTGSKVRCSKCKKVFVAYPPDLQEESVKEEVEVVEEIAEEPDELDLSELEDIFSEEADEEETEDFMEDLELELDMEPAKDEAVEAIEPEAGIAESDELDLADIEKTLDEEAAESVVEEPMEDLDLELTLEPELDKAEEEAELETDVVEHEEIDISEIEDMLSEEAAESAVEEPMEDLDLDLELEPEIEAPTEPLETEAQIEKHDELDLAEIEQALDSDDMEIEIDDEIEEVELELSTETPELEKVQGEEDAGILSEDLEDVDLTDIEKMLEVEDEVEIDHDEVEFEGLDDIGELVDTTDIDALDETEDMELELEGSEAADLVEDDMEIEEELEEEELEVSDPFYVETQIIDRTTEELIAPAVEAAAVEEKVEAKAKPLAKKRVSKPVLVLVILLLLGGLGVGTVYLLNYLNIEIPFVGDYLKPKAADPSGNLRIGTLDIKSKFIDNASVGKLLVITGQAKNEYSSDRSFIRVSGRLYATGKKLTSTATVFCGNVLQDNELKNLDIAAIKQRLANRTGDNNSNTQVKTGQQVPFMIVFANLPENLEEFEIEVAGSSTKQ